MQQITISGTLLNDAETCIDKKGNSYVRFDVTCGETIIDDITKNMQKVGIPEDSYLGIRIPVLGEWSYTRNLTCRLFAVFR